MSHLVAQMNVGRRTFNQKMNELVRCQAGSGAGSRWRDDTRRAQATYMELRQFPRDLRVRIRQYFKYFLARRTVYDEQAVVQMLSTQLQQEVSHFYMSVAVKDVPFFEGSRLVPLPALPLPASLPPCLCPCPCLPRMPAYLPMFLAACLPVTPHACLFAPVPGWQAAYLPLLLRACLLRSLCVHAALGDREGPSVRPHPRAEFEARVLRAKPGRDQGAWRRR